MEYINFWDAQKKAFDEWMALSQKTMESFSAKKSAGSGGDMTEEPAKLLQDYFSRLQNVFAGSLNMQDPKEALQNAPAQFQKWMEVQNEFAAGWAKLYKEQSAKYGLKVPDTEWPAAGKEAFEKGIKTWQEWLQQTDSWLQGGILSKIPENMQGHYKNFASSYSDLYRYWNEFEKMIRMGITQKEIIDQYFSPKAYQSFINKFMNFKPVANPDELIAESKKYFDRHIALLSNLSPDASAAGNFWKTKSEEFSASNFSPLYKAVLDLNRLMKNEMNIGFHFLEEGKETKAAKILRDMQFCYTVYVVKTAELQTKVYQAGSTALPTVLEEYYNGFKTQQQVPEYRAFFEKYVSALETRMDTVLHTKEYSVLQAEIAKASVELKAKYNELCELFLSDSPVVTRSQMDEMAQDNATLRTKLRSMEEKLDMLAGSEKKTTQHQPKEKTSGSHQDEKNKGNGHDHDDLKRIEGIGPKAEEILINAGIKTFEQLAEANVQYVKSLLKAAGPGFTSHDPATWMKQATLAAQGQWEKLSKWQEQLKAGK